VPKVKCHHIIKEVFWQWGCVLIKTDVTTLIINNTLICLKIKGNLDKDILSKVVVITIKYSK